MMPPCLEHVQRPENRPHLLCVRSLRPVTRPYDFNNYAKFFMMPLLLALGVDVAWIDLDVWLVRDPVPHLLHLASGVDGGEGTDILVTDHFEFKTLNHGVFFVKASDRTLLWVVSYLRWLHMNPFTHDQNGWDAFLGHSIKFEAMAPTEIAVSHRVLDTAFEYITHTGWSGTPADIPRVELIHFTGKGMEMRYKIRRLVRLFNATARLPGRSTALYRRRDEAALRHVLLKIQAPKPATKEYFYEDVHWAGLEESIGDGSYWRLFL